MSEEIKKYWRSVFSEDSGTGSASRVLTAFLCVNMVAMMWYVVTKNRAFPEPWVVMAWATAQLPFYGTNTGTNFLSNVASIVTSLKAK